MRVLMAIAVAIAVMLASQQAARGGLEAETETCLFIRFFSDESDDQSPARINPGQGGFIDIQIIELFDCEELGAAGALPLVELDAITEIEVVLLSGGQRIPWEQLDEFYEPGSEYTIIYDFDPEDETSGFRVTWRVAELDGSILFSDAAYYSPERVEAEGGDTIRYLAYATAGFSLDTGPGARVGTYEVQVTVRYGTGAAPANGEPDPTTGSTTWTVPLLTVVGPTVPSGVRTAMTCDGAVSVGSRVTCAVSADPGSEILWTARTNPVFETGVVQVGSDSTGTFSFVVPASALGKDVLVELVDWLAPVQIGTVAGPVPASVPAGQGPGLPLAFMLALALSVVLPMVRLARAAARG